MDKERVNEWKLEMGPSLDFISEIHPFSMRRGSRFLAVAAFLEEKSSRLFSFYKLFLWLKAPNRVSFCLLIFFSLDGVWKSFRDRKRWAKKQKKKKSPQKSLPFIPHSFWRKVSYVLLWEVRLLITRTILGGAFIHAIIHRLIAKAKIFDGNTFPYQGENEKDSLWMCLHRKEISQLMLCWGLENLFGIRQCRDSLPRRKRDTEGFIVLQYLLYKRNLHGKERKQILFRI